MPEPKEKRMIDAIKIEGDSSKSAVGSITNFFRWSRKNNNSKIYELVKQ